MPAALLRPCGSHGCPELVTSGFCLEHQGEAQRIDARRGTSTQRGYGVRWRAFRIWVRNRMIALHILPVCGATLPGGPQTTDSQCRAEGRLVGENPDGSELSLDHEPPLRADERQDPRAVCNARRVQFLCRECHARKTARQMTHG